ncbi:Abscisic acid G-protein coupled receptor-domain-containing protein [Cristinia sonorae]|uniref:Abscisic acid G-protein coupled receptor-domain-containing protein n=1 Tax=Cristinia sonorae TaxID=1940300 RepID=A0A8K0UHJ5_9AGAR|nr:Abscisic acid G-protein coupled receptor-domain-containing protein [Cristinia sonorae]
MSNSGAIVLGLESTVAMGARLILFYTCRRYLLASLYHDLQGLTSEGVVPSSAGELDVDAVELETLPTHSPSKHHHTPTPSRNRIFHSFVSRTLFSLSFSESCMLFLLLMCQGLDIFQPRTRLINWNISLYLLLTLIMVLIPLSYSLVLSYRSSPVSKTLQRPTILRTIISALPIALFTYLLSFIPLPTAMASASTGARILSRLVVVGIVILGLLSGFGAVNSAWTFFPRLSRNEKSCPTEQQIVQAEHGLARVRGDLAERHMALRRREVSQPKADSSWLGRMMPSFRGQDESSSAMQEITGLETLEVQMLRNLEAMKERRNQVLFASTLRGRVFQWGGRLFALYCVYRTIMAIVNLAIPTRALSAAPSEDGSGPDITSGTDFLTLALAHLTSLHPAIYLEPEDVAVVSRQISLGLVGIIILSSIRRVLSGVARALRVSSRNLGASLMLLMIAQVMGIYLLSTLIQLRTSFPPPSLRPDMESDEGTINLFSTLPEFQVFGSLFDGSYLVAAGVTAVVLWFDERINGVGVDDT